MIAEGATLAGKYRILDKLGEGAMGAVFRAVNTLTDKQVALKFLPPELAEHPDAVARLMREARVLSRVSHPNVVDVYDVLNDHGKVFLVLELLHGETLADYLAARPGAKISELIALLLPAMAGVAAAHRVGVLHRDLKPANIFIELRGVGAPPVAKVLDFGIAKLMAAPMRTSQPGIAHNQEPMLTQTGAALGTPLYMSLEQLRGDRDLDVRADVYAFGVMLYEIATCQKPYTAENLADLACQVATTDAPRVSSLRPDLPAGLAKTIDAAVARLREQRLPDIETFQRKLEPFALAGSYRRGVDRMQPMAAPAAAVSGDADTMLLTEVVAPARESGWRRVLWGALWLGIAGVLAAVGRQIVQEQVSEANVVPLDAGLLEEVSHSSARSAELVSPVEVKAIVPVDAGSAAAPAPRIEVIEPVVVPRGVGQERKVSKARGAKVAPVEVAPVPAAPTPAPARPKSHQEVLGF